MENLKEGIYRVCIPFENIYTSSFVLAEGNNAIILDSGDCDADAENYIIPSMAEINKEVKYLVLSHSHNDHSGGINALKTAYPNATELSFAKNNVEDNEVLLNRYKILNLKGHSRDCLGVLDLKTNTLVSCDSLQLRGVGRYPAYFESAEDYVNTINRIRGLKCEMIIASHNYEPYGYIATGEEQVSKYLDECENTVVLD